MDIEVPEWMNNEFAEETLRKSESDESIRVTKIAVTAATSKGDNYTSDMYRMSLEITRERESGEITEKLSVLVKVAPTEEGLRQEFVNDAGLFNTEISMMSDTLKKMNQLLGPADRVSANCIFTRIEPPALLVMEDLAPLGFRMACRQSGLDLAHCLITVRNLAKFHASSVALCEAEPKYKSMYTRCLFSRELANKMKDMMNSSVKGLAERISNWPGADPKCSEKLLRLSECTYEIGIEASLTLDDDFNVLTHGDCWLNNMLFKYDDNGEVTDQLFVDFQLPAWKSPALDLQQFLSTSPSDDVVINHRGLLLEEYLKTLASTMQRLGCETAAPSSEEIEAAMKRFEVLGMLLTFIGFPSAVAPKSEAKSFDEIVSTNYLTVDTEYCRKVILRRYSEYEAKGLLDV